MCGPNFGFFCSIDLFVYIPKSHYLNYSAFVGSLEIRVRSQALFFLFKTFFSFFLVCLGFELGLHAYKGGTLLLEPYLQAILLWLF
jgi:hypothetical protein